MCVFVCVCCSVHVYAQVYMLVCVSTWRPEADVRVSSLITFHFIFEMGLSLVSLELLVSARLNGG